MRKQERLKPRWLLRHSSRVEGTVCGPYLFPSHAMKFTEKQIQAFAEYFQILANVKRRLILEGRLHELEEEKIKKNKK